MFEPHTELPLLAEELDKLRFAGTDQNPKGFRDRLFSAAFEVARAAQRPAVLRPEPALLAKLGSIIQHIDEGLSTAAHFFDIEATRAVLADPEVRAWLQEMDALAMIPKKR